MRRVVIYGATSAMAESCARCCASRGDGLVLVGRRLERLEAIAADLRTRGARQVEVVEADLAAVQDPTALYAACRATLGGCDVLLVAYGVLPDQRACEEDGQVAAQALRVNFLSVVELLTPVAQAMVADRSGTIAVITSVAGERGRQSNYTYGAAKGGLDLWLGGLRNRLHASGVRVITIRPGFVDSPMTAAFPKGPLFVSSDAAGRAIERALRGGAPIVYVPWFWRWIMMIIRSIPERLFVRLKL